MTATEWVASLSPWPEEFGLGRMHALLDALGNPQRAFRSVHVVGTNGKSTATRTIAALLRAEGLDVGAYTSPHVSGWHERLDTDADSFERAVARVRAGRRGASARRSSRRSPPPRSRTSPSASVDAAVVEAGLGGRLDATNVIDARVVLLTNVGLEHTDVLGDTREKIAREKLAVARPGRDRRAPRRRMARPRARPSTSVIGGAREAAEAFARPRRSSGDVEVVAPRPARAPRPGRGPRRRPHARGRRLAARAPRAAPSGRSSPRSSATRTSTPMLERSAGAGATLIATRSSNRARARRAGTRRPRRAVLRACRGRPDPAEALGAGTRARARPRHRLALPPCRSPRLAARTKPCSKPGGSASPSSPSPSRFSRDSSACVRCGLHNREADPMSLLAADSTTFGGVHDFFHSETWYAIRNLGDPLRRRLLARRRVLGLQGRAAADPRTVARRARDAARPLPAVPRRARLHALPAARVPRGRARARARDQGDGGAAQPARQPVPGVPRDRRAVVPRLPRLHDAAQAGVRRTATQPLEALWQVCPYCETPVESTGMDLPVVEARPRRRRRSASK